MKAIDKPAKNMQNLETVLRFSGSPVLRFSGSPTLLCSIKETFQNLTEFVISIIKLQSCMAGFLQKPCSEKFV